MEDLKSIHVNIKRIRLARELTQENVARNIGVSVAFYRKIENGSLSPDWDHIQAIANALDVPHRYLYCFFPKLHSVRFRTKEGKPIHDKILMDVERWYGEYDLVEEVSKKRFERKIKGIQDLSEKMSGIPMSNDANRSEMAARFSRVVLGLNHEEPVRDISMLLESHGIRLGEQKVNSSSGFFGLSVFPQDERDPAIVVNTAEELSVECWIFSAICELAHLILHPDDYTVEIKQENEEHSKEAAHFASHFLMPESSLKKKWEETDGFTLIDRVIKVKRFFGVSYKTLLYRITADFKDQYIWYSFHSRYLRQYGKSLVAKEEYEHPKKGVCFSVLPEPYSSHEPQGLCALDFSPGRLKKLVRNAMHDGELSIRRCAEVLDISYEEMYCG